MCRAKPARSEAGKVQWKQQFVGLRIEIFYCNYEGYSSDAEKSKDGNLYKVQDHAEYDGSGKLTSDHGDRQRGHDDSQGR